MIRLMAILLFGVVMFAAAAAGSWFVQRQVLAKPSQDPQAAPAESNTTSSPPAPQAASPNGTAAPAAQDQRMPVAVRPREMSVEELLRYGMGVKEREQKVRQQEELLQQRSVQQQLALADIEGERKEIDGLRVQVGEQLKSAEKLIQKLNETREQLQQDRQAAAADLQQMKFERIEIDGQHLDNTKRLSLWLQSMEPEKAADVLKSMANDGQAQSEIAVQILANFEEREAAKILSAMDDPKLVQLLVEKFRNLKRPAKPPARR